MVSSKVRLYMQPILIPDSHRGLFDGDAYVALTTIMPDGQPQITPLWCNLEVPPFLFLLFCGTGSLLNLGALFCFLR
jgi:hypothetical protein